MTEPQLHSYYADPMWTREVKLSQRKLDPFGLSRVSQWLTDQLLPGITTVTSVARNYSFYAWAISNLLSKNKITRRDQFAYKLTNRESAYVIASILHEKLKANKLSPHGFDKANRFLTNRDGNAVSTSFDVSESNREGFYGLYYKNAMWKLGLTIGSSRFDDLTPLGKSLASFYEENIKDTEYFRNQTDNDRADISVLSEYGNHCCICRLADPSKERDLLRSILLSDNLPFLILERSRKETLLMVLSLIKECSSYSINFTDEKFRDTIFFGEISDGQKVVYCNFNYFQDIRARWRFFQLHEYFTYSMESLLHVMLQELKRKDEGMTFDDIVKKIGDPSAAVCNAFAIDRKDKFHEVILSVLNSYNLGFLEQETSKNFDNQCKLNTNPTEKTLFSKLKNAVQNSQTPEIVGDSLAILILNYIRSFQLLSFIDPLTIWFSSRASQEFSSLSFAREVRTRADEWELENFSKFCFNNVRNMHDMIAWNKLLSGNDTFRFTTSGHLLRFKMDIYPRYPTFRSSKIDSVLAILEQIGLVRSDSNVRALTEDGENILQSWLNERAHRPA